MGSEPKKKSYAGLITGAIAGVAVVGLVAGGIGGAVGYLAASNAAPPEAAAVSTPVVAEPEAA
ncbi:MAG: peptidase S1, partial [Actinobacteria bacterium]|nr:peptidase S1 [Actinomycetota bacterium]